MKKGQGISMNVIIIAAVALLVLVLLAVLIIGSLGEDPDYLYPEDLYLNYLEQQKQYEDCLMNYSFDYEMCIDFCGDDYTCRVSYISKWEDITENKLECLMWENEFTWKGTMNEACNGIVANATCTFQYNKDVIIEWHKHNRTDLYECTKWQILPYPIGSQPMTDKEIEERQQKHLQKVNEAWKNCKPFKNNTCCLEADNITELNFSTEYSVEAIEEERKIMICQK